MMLLEGLIAILIFSLGILAIVGLQTMAVKQVSDAGYRSEAGLLANQLLGVMWVTDRTADTLKADFKSPDGEEYAAWKTGVVATLPGAASHAPEVLVGDDGTVIVTMYWKPPGEKDGALPHKYVVTAQIKPDKES